MPGSNTESLQPHAMTNDDQQKLVAQTWERPFAPPEDIPASADIVIIGGGIVGVSTAWFLAQEGVNVVLG